MPLGLLELLVQIFLAIHAARTGRMQPWLWIILFLPGIGSVLYVIIELGPEIWGGRTGRRVSRSIARTVAPGRDYRALAREVEVAPTVHNKIRLADECLALGRPAEALDLYRACASGLHETDPTLRRGIARACYETGDYEGAVAALDAIRNDTPESRTADSHLLYARALEGAGRVPEALEEYEAVADYYSGEEARCRYAALLMKTGQAAAALEHYRTIVRRVDLQGGGYRRAQRVWYDTARDACRAAGARG